MGPISNVLLFGYLLCNLYDQEVLDVYWFINNIKIHIEKKICWERHYPAHYPNIWNQIMTLDMMDVNN